MVQPRLNDGAIVGATPTQHLPDASHERWYLTHDARRLRSHRAMPLISFGRGTW